MPEPANQITLYMKTELKAEVNRLANEEQRSFSQMVSILVMEAINNRSGERRNVEKM